MSINNLQSEVNLDHYIKLCDRLSKLCAQNQQELNHLTQLIECLETDTEITNIQELVITMKPTIRNKCDQLMNFFFKNHNIECLKLSK